MAVQMSLTKIKIPMDEITAFCRRHHIRRLGMFGSVLREDFSPTGDVDILVEFEPDHVPGLSFFEMEEELSQILSKPSKLIGQDLQD